MKNVGIKDQIVFSITLMGFNFLYNLTFRQLKIFIEFNNIAPDCNGLQPF